MEGFGELVVEDVFDERTLAAAANASNSSERSKRKFDADVFEIVVTASYNFQPSHTRFAPLLGHANGFFAAEIRPGDAAALAWDFVRPARGHDLSAKPTGAWTEVKK